MPRKASPLSSSFIGNFTWSWAWEASTWSWAASIRAKAAAEERTDDVPLSPVAIPEADVAAAT